mmetsp:Transcript_20682/g.52987  ORF Transcript_20682/g.52987 Transcript_20682/m.52987 type:complete len:263 (-) Transcript_20682:160-948(-)
MAVWLAVSAVDSQVDAHLGLPVDARMFAHTYAQNRRWLAGWADGRFAVSGMLLQQRLPGPERRERCATPGSLHRRHCHLARLRRHCRHVLRGVQLRPALPLHRRKLRPYRALHVQRLVPLLAKAAARCGGLHVHGEVDDGVGRWQAHLGRGAPRKVQPLRALGRRERDAAVAIAVHHQRGAPAQGGQHRRALLPAVGGEQQMDRCIVHLHLASQVAVDHLAYRGRTVREPPEFGMHACIAQRVHQQPRLRGLAAAIHSLKHD